jgi:hypothetical protein
MFRRLPTTALLGALALALAAGCGSPATTDAGRGHQTGGDGSKSTGKPGETGKSTAKGPEEHHHPG